MSISNGTYIIRKFGTRVAEKKGAFERAAKIVLADAGLDGADVLNHWLPSEIEENVEDWLEQVVEQTKDQATLFGGETTFQLAAFGEDDSKIHGVGFNMVPHGDSKGYGPNAYSGTTSSIIKQGLSHLEVSKKMENKLIIDLFERHDRVMEMQTKLLEKQSAMLEKSMTDREKFYERLVKNQDEKLKLAQDNKEVTSSLVHGVLDKFDLVFPMILKAVGGSQIQALEAATAKKSRGEKNA